MKENVNLCKINYLNWCVRHLLNTEGMKASSCEIESELRFLLVHEGYRALNNF